jgi:DNA-directed RNA polymerase subunit alpha
VPGSTRPAAHDRLETPLAETDLHVRTVNCLEDESIFTVKDLLNCTPERLMEIPNFGEKTLQMVYDALEKEGFCRRSGRAEEERGEHTLFGE